MATLSWSSPLELAVVIAAVSLVFRPERPGGRLNHRTIAGRVCRLGHLGPFSSSGAAVAVVIGLLAEVAAWRRAEPGEIPVRCSWPPWAWCWRRWRAWPSMLDQRPPRNRSSHPAGFGDLWKVSPYGLKHQAWPVREIINRLWPVAGLAILASLYLTVRRSRRLPRIDADSSRTADFLQAQSAIPLRGADC